MKRYSAVEREWILEEFQRSGLSRAAFCRREGLCYATLRAWLKRAPGEEATKRDGESVTFVELDREGAEDRIDPGSGCIEVVLVGGSVVRFAGGTDVSLVARFCRELER